LSFQELELLSSNPAPTGPLSEKLARFWTTPIIDNRAFYSGVRPTLGKNQLLGEFVRVATWNIEKSYQMSEVIGGLTSESIYRSQINPEFAPEGSERRNEMLRQRVRLATSDIILLQEMDIGVNRSGYRNAARDLANALGMNYAYGAQTLEIDPVILGLEPIRERSGKIDTTTTEFFQADPDRYKGVFGSAVLSKFPIKNVEVFQLKTLGYDWYEGEKARPTFLEGSRRLGAKLAFHNIIAREMKVGGRNFFRVDLEVPGLPNNTLTIINIHLEIKCLPDVRKKQMEEILSYIGDIDNPVVMAGDHNSSSTDISPTSIERAFVRATQKPSSYLSLGAMALAGPAVLVNDMRIALNGAKNFHTPLALNIPVLAPNPVKPMINSVRRFRFDDGGGFDFRGDHERSINGRSGALANSNHKDLKGQVSSFSVKRPIGVFGLYRLDWVWVKPYGGVSPERNGSYAFSPHFGETLVDFNKGLSTPYSDHRPCIIDLPLAEPLVGNR